MRTISVSEITEQRPDDLDGRVVEGLEALRQRVVQAIRFRIKTWFLNQNRGLDYDLILGHRITAAQAASVLGQAILDEGGDEIEGLENVEYSIDSETRTFRYSVLVNTIWGTMPLSENIG